MQWGVGNARRTNGLVDVRAFVRNAPKRQCSVLARDAAGHAGSLPPNWSDNVQKLLNAQFKQIHKG